MVFNQEASMKNMTLLMASLFLLMASQAFAEKLQIMEKEGLGKYLADEKGMTLYIFTKDSPGMSACVDPCVEKWPLLQAEKIEAPAGTRGEDFAAISRSDGQMQTTYKELPLYYFFKDEKPGEVAGQGAGGVWFVAQP
jgi:predicted lipoprotein with Yx(FWY)xxD motif